MTESWLPLRLPLITARHEQGETTLIEHLIDQGIPDERWWVYHGSDEVWTCPHCREGKP